MHDACHPLILLIPYPTQDTQTFLFVGSFVLDPSLSLPLRCNGFAVDCNREIIALLSLLLLYFLLHSPRTLLPPAIIYIYHKYPTKQTNKTIKRKEIKKK